MRLYLGFVLALLTALTVNASEPASFSGFSVQPQVLVNGSVCLFTVHLAGSAKSVTAKWLGHDVSFSQGPGDIWFALAGVAYDTKPGSFELDLEAVTPGSQTLRSSHTLTVHPANYKTSRLTVPQKYVTPDPESLKRIEAEKEIKSKAFAHFLPAPQWIGDFVAPVSTQVSESYGTSRTLNGKLATVHRGVDFRAATGTPIHASNAGEVILAQDLYYEGNCVVIDHGLGFMTMYMHLSKLEVREGDHVGKDQVIALSGGTGRVTGPHLHLAVRWSGEYLDPLKLLALKLEALNKRGQPSQP
jgi:murein DD-endopeptidase MepM/ murein hydrolase activator NlpD